MIVSNRCIVVLHNSNVRVQLIELAPRDSQEALTLAKRFYAAQTYTSRCELPETEVSFSN